MGNPKRIGTNEKEDTGVIIEYVKSRKMLYIYGWYDGYGIKGVQYTLDEFCEQLGIKRSDIRQKERMKKTLKI